MKKTSPKIVKKVEDDVKTHLYCPYCGAKHIDNDWYALNPHRHHLCFKCGKKFWVRKPTIGIS